MRDYFSIIEKFIQNRLAAQRIFGGSIRRFYRIWTDNGSYVALIDEDRQALVQYARLLTNLLQRGIPVPRVYAVDESAGIMLMEDVGSLSLYEWYSKTDDPEPHFRAAKALAKIHTLQDIPGKIYADFGIPDLLYETRYFVRHFLVGYCDFPETVEDALADDFFEIAGRVDHSPRALMHRDYQSQNIFIVPGGVKIVDFQGARRGYKVYDLASFVEDPYVNLPYSLTKNLIKHYIEFSDLTFGEMRAMMDAYPYAAIQRLLQATAAFSYLSRIQRKYEYEKFILPALDRAIDWAQYLGEFPVLEDVLRQARRIARIEIQIA